MKLPVLKKLLALMKTNLTSISFATAEEASS